MQTKPFDAKRKTCKQNLSVCEGEIVYACNVCLSHASMDKSLPALNTNSTGQAGGKTVDKYRGCRLMEHLTHIDVEGQEVPGVATDKEAVLLAPLRRHGHALHGEAATLVQHLSGAILKHSKHLTFTRQQTLKRLTFP